VRGPAPRGRMGVSIYARAVTLAGRSTHACRWTHGHARRIALLGILFLSLDPPGPLRAQQSLQDFVHVLRRGRRGALIVSNPRTGEILALANPETVFARAFPPGSTAKLVESAVALEEGLISPDDRIFCRQVPELLGRAYRCSHAPAVAPFTLRSALANSCNYFFAALSVRLTSTSLAHGYAVFGFGSPVAGPWPAANAGQVRIGDDPRAKARAALGESTVLVTPAQLLLAYSAIATRGLVFRLWKPSAGQRHSPLLLRRVKLRSETFKVLREGLEECVRSGTGGGAAVEGVRVAGKTGTAAALDQSGATHAWFVGYAPAEDPEIALVVFLERGTGIRDAAPLAGRILKHYFAGKGRKP
jgi:cell division protein FtsI/penicillin-binding protein 2